MQKYSKFLTALAGAAFAGLAAFGVVVPEGLEASVASIIGAVTPLLVYLIPNAAE